MGGKQVNLDTILFDIGQFGKSQRLTYMMIALPIMCASMYNMNYNFTARHMSYRQVKMIDFWGINSICASFKVSDSLAMCYMCIIRADGSVIIYS